MNKYLFFLGLMVLAACGFFERKPEGGRVQKIVSSLSPYERKILSSFFRLLLEEECCGYSLYGAKPLSVQEFAKDIPLAINEDLMRRSSLLREGMRIWERSGLALIKSNYIMQSSKLSDADGWIDVFFINQRSFLDVVERNLPLFQYVLGPKVTSLSLLSRFLDPMQNLSSVLREDRVLIGLILGYGVQNALHGSRLEYLHEHLDGSDAQHVPSFGFSNILDEKEHLQCELFITTDRGSELPRLPWFAAISHEETDRLLKAYQTTQKKLKKVLASPHFLEETLLQFFGSQITLPPSQLSLETLLFERLQKQKNIPLLIGRRLWVSLQKEHATVLEIQSFIQGMLNVSGKREDLAPLLRRYDRNGCSEDKKPLLYRLGQKIGDHYRALESIVSVEEIAACIREPENGEINQQDQWEIIDQVHLLARFYEPIRNVKEKR